ncbi:T9SS type A sorting domain-containing protein [Gemmatimonadota bacterium]
MKSRLLSTAAAMFLLLGLVSTSAFAQISSSAAVNFYIQSYDIDEDVAATWHDLTSTNDTIGRKIDVLAQWTTASQSLSSIVYTLVLPAGTVLDSTALGGTYLYIYDGAFYGTGPGALATGAAQTVLVDTADITLGVNMLDDYGEDSRPWIKVASNVIVSTEKTFQLRLTEGVYIGKLVAEINSSDNDFMEFSFATSGQAGTTFEDNDVTGLTAINGLPEGVRFNTAIRGYVDGGAFSVNDSIVFIDIFGNEVPDFPLSSAAAETELTISVATGAGTFSLGATPTTTGIAAANLSLDADEEVVTVMFDDTPVGDVTATGVAAADGFLHDGTTNRWIILGGSATTQGGLQLSFDGVDTQDSTTFIVELVADDDPTGAPLASGEILGEEVDLTSTIKRARLADDADEEIGTVTVTHVRGGDTYVGGVLNATTFTIALKNIFGEAFTTETIGTGTAPLAYKFEYESWVEDGDDDVATIDDAKTTLLQSGGAVSSKYTMSAATFDETVNTDVFDGMNIEGTMVGGVLDIHTASLPVYMGLASHPYDAESDGDGDSILVTIYAENDPDVYDEFRIKVQPGSPVAFDTDTLLANLADISPVQGKSLGAALPIFALDTAYNRVYNLDLSADAGEVANADMWLDDIEVSSSAWVPAISLTIDGRDPLGYDATTLSDSIKLGGLIYDETPDVAGERDEDLEVTGDPKVEADSSFILGLARSRLDSSVINLGSVNYTGDEDWDGEDIDSDPLDMILNLRGVNRVLGAVWNPAQMGGGWEPLERSQDLALINLGDTVSVDSVGSISVVSATQKAGQAVDTVTVRFRIPQGNTIGPNEADSLIYIKFSNMAGAPGLPVGLAAASVMISPDDGANFYAALGVSEITSTEEDSVWAATPVTVNTTTGAKWVQVKILTFVNPTVANVDSTKMYYVTVKTEANPVPATSTTAMNGQVIAGDAARLVIATPLDTLENDGYPRWISDIVDVTTAVPLSAGVASGPWKILQADMYGNIVNEEAGLAITDSIKYIFKTVDSTSTGDNSLVTQKYNSNTRTGSGDSMYDTLRVKIDSVDADNDDDRAIYADSVMVTLFNSNMATSYYVVISDSTGLVKDSVLVALAGGAVASLTLDPDSNMIGERETALPMLTVTPKDAYGNPVGDVSVTIARTYGADGAFIDTNGAEVTTEEDTVVIVTGDDGVATAIYETGALIDSVALMVSATGATSVYFTASLQVADELTAFSVTSPADSLEPDLGWVAVVDEDDDTTWVAEGAAGTIVAEVSDGNDVAEVWVNVWRSELTQNAEMTFDESVPTLIEKAASATGSSDVVTVSLAIGDTANVDTAVVIRYQLVAVDADDDTTYSDTMMYVAAPNRGKRNMSSRAVNVGDVMRLVYLAAIESIVPTVVDYLGLDLNVDGMFDLSSDLVALRAIWQGTGTMLAGVSVPENSTAKAELSYEATDKASANLALNLESSADFNMALFRIKYDTEKFSFGEAKATERLRGVSVVTGNNTEDGVYTIVLINVEGGQIVKGSGAILNIQISAVGDKFDGVGEVSLLNAEFEQEVAAEISREVLSPKALLPKAFALSQNYPNPFNPSTTIAYEIPEGDNVQVQLKVYNMRGQLVRTLVDESRSEGSYQIQWDGSDNYGRRVSSGVYFYRIKAGEFSKTRKMVILK